MSPREYLALAERLLATARAVEPPTAPAAECRTAISRAYYAAYNCAVDFLDFLGFETTNSHNCHTAVQFALNQSGSVTLRDAASHLNALHTERRRADYELKNPRSEQLVQAEAMVLVAGSAFDLIDAARLDRTRWGEIASAVLAYVTTSQTSALRRKVRS